MSITYPEKIGNRQLKLWIQSLGLITTENHRFGIIIMFETIGVDFYPRKMSNKHFGMVSSKRWHLN